MFTPCPFQKAFPMSAALNEFREISFLLYKIAKPDQYDTMNELLIRVQALLEIQESHNGCCESPSIRIQRTPPLMPMTPPRDLIPSFGEDLRPPTPPTLVINPDHEIPPTVVVTKEPDQTKTIKVQEPVNIVVNVPVTISEAVVSTPDDEEDDDAAIIADLQEAEEAEPEAEEEAEAEPEAEEEAEAEPEAEEAEEEEAEPEAEEADVEEDYDVEKIGKRRYFVGQTTRKVYERIDAETIGEYLGVLRDGKIVPN